MALPQGFDPATGRFTGVSAPRIQSSYNNTVSSSAFSSFSFDDDSDQSVSWWERLNDIVKSIGNWIDSKIEPVSGWITLICMILGGIGLLCWVFHDGDILYIILRFFGAVIMGGIWAVGLGIGLWILAMCMKIVRFVFWNIYTLLITLAVVGVLLFNSDVFSGSSSSGSDATEQVMTMGTVYECTAKVLNVRMEPNAKSGVLGVLRKGQTVEVLEASNGFARIDFNGQTGYVSLDYLQSKQ